MTLRHSLVWAAILIGALSLVRFARSAGEGPYGLDASYYFQIARHVANGEGLITTASLYHEGRTLPGRADIYPLWPLMLGLSGRAIGLFRAANVLPQLFYILDLLLLYLVARRVALHFDALRLVSHAAVPDVAHLVMAAFGMNIAFFGATTHPYTEGLAFACAFSAFLALGRFERTGGTASAALCGVLAAMAFLARTQMIGVAIGIFLALAVFAWRDRDRRRGLVAFAAAAVFSVIPWLLYIGHVPGIAALKWNHPPTVGLPPFHGSLESRSGLDWLLARGEGALVAFRFDSPYSYVRTFGAAAFLVPVAAAFWMWKRARRERGALSMTVMAIAGAGMVLLVHLLVHEPDAFLPWLFGWRHGLPLIFLIVVAAPYLAASAGRIGRAIVAALLVLSIAMGARKVMDFVRASDLRWTPGERALLQWLDAQPGKVTIITTNAQILSAFSRAHAHWTDCASSGESTRAMLRLLPIDYIVMYEREIRCPFVAGVGEPMRVAAVFGAAPARVFILRPAPKH